MMALQDAGIVARGSGADNIRNITGSPTAGIDRDELFDTRPLSAQMHHHILHHRELYGLPRKFNIAFDGGGAISAVADTNDIGFVAVRVGEGKAVPAGVYFRVQLGGITGHGDFARDTGLLLQPEQCVAWAAAAVRVSSHTVTALTVRKRVSNTCSMAGASTSFSRSREAASVRADASAAGRV
jgi:ferredoxin-nitrite reductase